MILVPRLVAGGEEGLVGQAFLGHRTTEKDEEEEDVSCEVDNVMEDMDDMNGAEGELTEDQATGVSGSGKVPVDKKEMKLERERRRLENAVRKLTINKEKSIDHKGDLENSAQLLNDARRINDKSNVHISDLDALKARILSSTNIDEVLKSVRSCPELQMKISDNEQSKIFE